MQLNSLVRFLSILLLFSLFSFLKLKVNFFCSFILYSNADLCENNSKLNFLKKKQNTSKNFKN